MPRNVYFSQGTTPEKRLYEDITIEALKIYGHDVYYIPRTIVNTNAIFNEDALSKFGEAFQIEMYVENTDGFEGDGDLLSKFGVEVRDSMTLVLATRRWEELVGRFQSTPESRPQEGDLIYFPLVKGLFQISFVEDESPFYQLTNLPTFKLTCELFEYGNEAIDTGIVEVDQFETDYASRIELTLGTGSGIYEVGEDVTQTNATSGITVTGEVSTVSSGKIEISSQVASDGSNTLFAPTSAGTTGNIIGATSTASYEIASIDAFSSIDSNDPYADNEDFETIGNNFIDFTETNPFGEPNVIS
tara:strand:- start:1011 stop:1916 length:906 start_codon:yes stop_codon:yes gene_type:complete